MSRSLGEFELSVLLAVIRLGDDAYGAAVLRTIEARTGREVKSGPVYTALDRLQKRRLIESSVGEPTRERGGRRRRFYRITGAGLEAVRSTLHTIHSLTEGLGQQLARLSADAGT